MAEKIFDLEERLIRYASAILEIVESLPRNRVGEYLSAQLTRSGLSTAFNYSESQAAESPADFIHKLSIVLKELKECRTALKIIDFKKLAHEGKTEEVLLETHQLIAIIGKSISTAKKNVQLRKLAQ